MDGVSCERKEVTGSISTLRRPGLSQLPPIHGCRFGIRDVEQHFETGIFKGDKINMNRFLVVIERAGKNFSAYSPDLPGCVATGSTREAAEKNIREAIIFHINGLKEEKRPVPESHSFAKYIVIAA